MTIVLGPSGKTKQFKANQKDTIRCMPEVKDNFYFLCSESLEFPFGSNLGHVSFTGMEAYLLRCLNGGTKET